MKSSVLAFQYANKKNETLLLSLLKMAREQGINPEFYCEVIGLIQKLFYIINDFEIGTTFIPTVLPILIQIFCPLCRRDIHVRRLSTHMTCLLQSSSFKGRFFFGCVVLLLL